MLRDLGSNYHVYIACGYTDLRLGVDGLTRIVKNNFDKNPYDESNIYLFCGRRTDRIKALVYEGDGFVLLYKRLVRGRYQWPRYEEDLKMITYEEYKWLMQGFSIERRHPIKEMIPAVI